MTEWQSPKLKDLLIDSNPGFACGEDDPVGVFQFRMNNLNIDGSLDFSKIRRVPQNKKNLKKFYLQKGDVLFNATNSPELVGKSAFFPGHSEIAVYSNHFVRLRPRDDVLEGRYLARWLQAQFRHRVFRDMCRQWVNQATVSREALLGLSIPLPPIATQKHIAAILDQAEELRSKRRSAIALLDELGRSVFLEMFGDPRTNPKNWDSSTTLGEIANIASGITKGRKLNGKQTREISYLAVVNVQDKSLDLNTVKTIDATEDEINRFLLQGDDLLLTEGGDPDKLGRGTLWNNEISECIHQNHIFRVRLTSDTVVPLFLNWLIGSKRGKDYFLKSAKQTTGIASINMSQLRGFPMLIPPLELQQQFAKRMEAIETLKTTHRQSLAKLDSLFNSLQSAAFNGELGIENEEF